MVKRIAWNKKDITGQVFGKLTALRFSHTDKFKKSIWICKCACSRYTSIALNALTAKQRTSCGCKTFKQGPEKVCRKCKNVLSIPTTFAIGRLNAKNWICNDCYAEYYIALTLSRPYRNKSNNLKAKYGITFTEYSALYTLQGGLCAICAKEAPALGAGKNGLYVDHCHKSNKVRGLLCCDCNFMLGLARDNTNILSTAIKYLE